MAVAYSNNIHICCLLDFHLKLVAPWWRNIENLNWMTMTTMFCTLHYINKCSLTKQVTKRVEFISHCQKICEQINERFNANKRRKARSMSSIINRWHILVMRSNAYTMYHLLEVVVILSKNAWYAHYICMFYAAILLLWAWKEKLGFTEYYAVRHNLVLHT